MKILLSLTLLFFTTFSIAQKRVPEATELYVDLQKVTPGDEDAPPSDAIVLFNGQNLEEWQKPQFDFGVSMKEISEVAPKMDPDFESMSTEWVVTNKEMVVKPGKGSIATKRSFGDVQLHIEWLAPETDGKTGQGYSNSGVFFMGMYEVQILNSYDNITYNNGQASAVYKQHIPLVNASLPPGEWQEYDIIFMAPKFSEKGTLVSPARITVFHNGVLVQNNVTLLGPTCYIGAPYYVAHAEKLPLILQDHGDPVRFRNIWIREL